SLIVPAKDAVVQYAQENGLDYSDYEKLLQTEQVKDLIYKEVTTKDSPANGFRTCERIAKIALLPNSFKVGEELSAKQEMMRFKIVEKYASLIATLF
ncbi:MAG: long-chain fatty acid--CoA ligase, partial [Treponema sp.]|nr:long-chain fatty acid--CoA ligase [Treponema sp.]